MFKPLRTAAALPAQDMARAKAFYRDKLGLTPTMEDPSGMMYALPAGTGFGGFPPSGQPARAPTPTGNEGEGVGEGGKDPYGQGGQVLKNYRPPTQPRKVITRPTRLDS